MIWEFRALRSRGTFSSPRDMVEEMDARLRYSYANARGWAEDQYTELYKYAAATAKEFTDLDERVKVADLEFLVSQASLPFNSFCVYALTDANGALLYVGQTQNPWRRIGNHRDKEWGSQIQAVSLVRCGTRAEALELESRMIWELRPKFNIVGSLNRFSA